MHLEFRVKPINDKKDTYWTAPRVFHRLFFFFLVENFKTLFQFFLLLLIKRLNERYRGISVGRTEEHSAWSTVLLHCYVSRMGRFYLPAALNFLSGLYFGRTPRKRIELKIKRCVFSPICLSWFFKFKTPLALKNAFQAHEDALYTAFWPFDVKLY